MNSLRLIFLLSILFTGSISYGQPTNDRELANYYYDTGDYEKAILYFEKLYKANPSNSHYRGLVDSYMELGMYKDAEKLVKQQLKKSESNLYFIDLGNIYSATGEEGKAKDSYEEAIKTLRPSQGLIIRTANEFIRLNKQELALETYKEGKKLLNNSYPFSYEIASIYGSMGDTERMIEEYLDLLTFNEAYLQTIQNALNRSIDFENDAESIDILRTSLLRRVQKQPQNTTYPEMLTWLFVQQKDFNSAFVQLRALDKRLGEDGQRLLNLANLCINNENYKVAAKCYRYISDKGPSNPYYSYARSGVLKADFEELRMEYPPDTTAMNKLRKDYQTLLEELGRNQETIGLLRQKAMLEGYYLNDLEAANRTLNEALDIPLIHPDARAEMKLELAKILIARDYIWDASLLCSQVDKDYKNDVLGYQAKYLNARISYYTGDFEWSQAQLDVLKGSTTKLISNDAMELSLLITDNMNLDTILDPMLKFARADLLTIQRRFTEATTVLDSIVDLYPGHALSDEILLQRASIEEAKNDYMAAIGYYQKVLENHYFEITADNALFRMADLYEMKLNDTDKAAELYKQLFFDFPGSLYVVEARKRFRTIRGDGAENEIFRQIIPDSDAQ